MEHQQPISLFQKLFTAVVLLFDHPELHPDTEELKIIFYDKVSEILQLSFDIHITPQALATYEAAHTTDDDPVSLAQFIVDTIENDTSYILLNYFLYQFIQKYMDSMKQDASGRAMRLLLHASVSEKELQMAADQYQQCVSEHNPTPAAL